MLTGELPGKKIEPPSKKVQIDVRLDEVVLRALEKEPELRYQQASILKTQLETIATSAAPEKGHAQNEDVPSFPKWLLWRIGLPQRLTPGGRTRRGSGGRAEAQVTNQQIADEALALWQSHRGDDQERMDSILKEYFAQVRADEYEEIQSCVTEIFSERPIFYSDLPCHLSEAL